MKRGLTLVLLAALLDAGAEEVDVQNGPVYESVDGVSIGRVFLSPGERKRLDAVRHLPQDTISAGAGEAVPAGEEEPAAPKGVGFIQVSGKAPRVFRDGDFVRAPRGEPSVETLPTGVIVRHEARDPEQEGSGER